MGTGKEEEERKREKEESEEQKRDKEHGNKAADIFGLMKLNSTELRDRLSIENQANHTCQEEKYPCSQWPHSCDKL